MPFGWLGCNPELQNFIKAAKTKEQAQSKRRFFTLSVDGMWISRGYSVANILLDGKIGWYVVGGEQIYSFEDFLSQSPWTLIRNLAKNSYCFWLTDVSNQDCILAYCSVKSDGWLKPTATSWIAWANFK